jgi:hypothetical protein
MAKQRQSEPGVSLDRGQLLVTVTAAVIVAGAVPNSTAQVTNSAEAVNATTIPASETLALNVCPATASRIEEIAFRNRIRAEARLPLLSIPKELRRMKQAADLADFLQ